MSFQKLWDLLHWSDLLVEIWSEENLVRKLGSHAGEWTLLFLKCHPCSACTTLIVVGQILFSQNTEGSQVYLVQRSWMKCVRLKIQTKHIAVIWWIIWKNIIQMIASTASTYTLAEGQGAQSITEPSWHCVFQETCWYFRDRMRSGLLGLTTWLVCDHIHILCHMFCADFNTLEWTFFFLDSPWTVIRYNIVCFKQVQQRRKIHGSELQLSRRCTYTKQNMP